MVFIFKVSSRCRLPHFLGNLRCVLAHFCRFVPIEGIGIHGPYHPYIGVYGGSVGTVIADMERLVLLECLSSECGHLAGGS